MQHLTSVIWSLDNKFVLSASDEMNIRLWKANASEKLGTVSFFCEFKLICIAALRLEPHFVIEQLWLNCKGFPVKYIIIIILILSVKFIE